ncbi:MATE family efflux transporter [Clostridiaceae bacterium M8S5]|nr:MATE family efflux transporter [Clostridiaceae bacterium M8S5]
MFNKNNIREVLKLSLPAVGEMILYMLIWVFDTMMVGNYGGKVSVTAVGLTSEIIYTFINILIAMGISVGITSLVARELGAKNKQKAEEYASLGFVCTIAIALIVSLIFFIFPSQILTMAKAKGKVLFYGARYMRICSIGTFFNMAQTSINAVLRGSGNTKTPLKISIVVNVVNITLDWVLIYGKFGLPELGVSGAAIATTTANICGMALALSYTMKSGYIKPKLKYIKNYSVKRLKGLINLSIPSALQEGAFSISRLINIFMIMLLGDASFSANQITTTIESLSYMPGWGFAVAATTLVGNKVGAKDYKKAREYMNICLLFGTGIMALLAVVFLLFPNQLIALFIKDSETQTISLGASCLVIASIEQIPIAISMIIGGGLKGSGDTKSPFIVSVISNWAFRLPMMYYFIYVNRKPVTYAWRIAAVQWFIDAILLLIIYKRRTNEWKNLEKKFN